MKDHTSLTIAFTTTLTLLLLNTASAQQRDMTRATTQASITSQTITVEHIRISSELSFAEVRRKLEGTVPKLDIGIAEARSRRRFLRAASTIRPWCAS